MNLSNLGGLENGSLYSPPSWVDTKKNAGETSISKSHYGKLSLLEYLNPIDNFFFSPNLVWFLITVIVYIMFPYDLVVAKSWALSWVLYRCVVNVCVMLVYVGYWHITLYWLGWAKRKFDPTRTLSTSRLFHNIFYSMIGAVIGGLYESMFMHAWATGKLVYIDDSQVFASIGNTLRMTLWIIGIPLFREIHFYFAHKFIHFSGLCMHPIEHLYYITSILPSLVCLMSPFHVMWNIQHLILSPAASHSGWEDNWQSDQFHYLHHAYFECNYGTQGMPWDLYFGTFKDTLTLNHTHHSKGKANLEIDVSNSERNQKKKLHSYIPSGPFSISEFKPASIWHGIYDLFSLLIFWVLLSNLFSPHYWSFLSYRAIIIPFIVSIGPLILAILLNHLSGDSFSAIWPFHKVSSLNLLFHGLASFVLCIFPVYYLVYLCLM